MGLPLQVTVPQIEGIRWRYCEHWDEEPAAKLGISLLRLGICNPDDWAGSAVDFVERGLKRLSQKNGIDEVRKVWDGDIRILDQIFELGERERCEARAEANDPVKTLFLVVDFSSAASIPIEATLSVLEREHRGLSAAFFVAFRRALQKWMLVYDHEAAREHVEVWMPELDPADSADSVYPQVATSLPGCLLDKLNMDPSRAFTLLRAIHQKLGACISRDLVGHLLQMWKYSTGYPHYWPSGFVPQVPGLDDYLEDCDGIGPGCLLNWYEDDPISACFNEEMECVGQNGPIAPSLLRVIRLHRSPRTLDRDVARIFKYIAAMICSLACAAKIVEIIRELYDEHLRQHRIESGLQAQSSAPDLRPKQL
jgi:hypothetical protein